SARRTMFPIHPVLTPRFPARNLLSSNVWLNGVTKSVPLNQPSVETSIPLTRRWMIPLHSAGSLTSVCSHSRSSRHVIVLAVDKLPFGLTTHPSLQPLCLVISPAAFGVSN